MRLISLTLQSAFTPPLSPFSEFYPHKFSKGISSLLWGVFSSTLVLPLFYQHLPLSIRTLLCFPLPAIFPFPFFFTEENSTHRGVIVKPEVKCALLTPCPWGVLASQRGAAGVREQLMQTVPDAGSVSSPTASRCLSPTGNCSWVTETSQAGQEVALRRRQREAGACSQPASRSAPRESEGDPGRQQARVLRSPSCSSRSRSTPTLPSFKGGILGGEKMYENPCCQSYRFQKTFRWGEFCQSSGRSIVHSSSGFC